MCVLVDPNLGLSLSLGLNLSFNLNPNLSLSSLPDPFSAAIVRGGD